MHMVAVRLHEGDDLKQTIENLVKTKALSSATIISAVGSLTQVRIRMAGAQPHAQDIRTLQGPFEIVSLIGNLGPGRSHIHIAVSDKDGAVHGGHLKEASIVHTTVELVLATDANLTFTEQIDAQTGFGELHIQT